ncbi:DUF3054 domain-containing protein [Halovivax cerinus]|uniref:DUF3054 domain-containing protein n=1 Tax=Halovivax cerinus TaxID=1487865 RepID=A0ABD5NN14_9EURY|nr:DUF3054 domain-containing protein [Halovivax cerinus]
MANGEIRALAVDSFVIGGLALLGLLRHRGDPIEDPGYALATIAPFVLGWIGCATLSNLYRDRRRIGLTTHLRSVLICWLAATNVAFLIRGSPVAPGNVPWSFMAVMVGLGSVAVLGSRLTFEWVVRSREERL